MSSTKRLIYLLSTIQLITLLQGIPMRLSVKHVDVKRRHQPDETTKVIAKLVIKDIPEANPKTVVKSVVKAPTKANDFPSYKIGPALDYPEYFPEGDYDGTKKPIKRQVYPMPSPPPPQPPPPPPASAPANLSLRDYPSGAPTVQPKIILYKKPFWGVCGCKIRKKLKCGCCKCLKKVCYKNISPCKCMVGPCCDCKSKSVCKCKMVKPSCGFNAGFY